MISFLPLTAPHDPAGCSLEETEPGSAAATWAVEAAGAWALSPQAEWVSGKMGRGAPWGGMSSDLNQTPQTALWSEVSLSSSS